MRFSAKRLKRWTFRHKWWVMAGSVGVLSSVYLFVAYVMPPKLQTHLSLSDSVSVTAPLVFHSGQFLAQDNLQVSISPKIDLERSFALVVPMGTKLTVKPKTRFQPNTIYTVTVSGIRTQLGVEASQEVVKFKTEGRPKVTGLSDQKDLGRTAPLTINFDRPNDNIAKFRVAMAPVVELSSLAAADGKSIVLTPKTEWPQGQSLTVNLYDDYTSVDAPVWTGTAKVHDPVTVSSITPNASQVKVDEKVTASFAAPVDQDSAKRAFSITPAVVGAISFEGNNLVFTPSAPLAHGQTYTVKIAQGVTDAKKGILPADVTQSFTTYGEATLAGASPRRGSTNVSVGTNISLTFNQPVDHGSAQQRASISPAAAGSYSWSGNTLTFHPSGLAKFTTYSFAVAPGVVATYGTPSTRALSTSFETEPPVTQLSMTYYHQQHSLTCEVAALRMALTHYGMSPGEIELMNLVGYNGPPTLSGGVWGDPNVGFVGSIDGNGTTTGYGVYWGPVASAANNYRPSSAFSGAPVGWIAQQVQAGYPVVVWGTVGHHSPMSWTTGGGTTINAINGEHAYVVKGFKGTPDRLLSFYIYDPIRGQLTWTPGQLAGDAGVFGISGVVVR